MIKPFFSLLITLGLLLTSCEKTLTYTDSLTSEELSEKALETLHSTDFLSADSSYLSDYIDLSHLPKGTVFFAADGKNLDEFGIWHLPAEQVGEMKNLLESYLSESLERNRSFYDSYIPEETPKLRDAEVRVFGNYVAYAILSEHDRARFFQVLKNELTPEKS